MSSTTKSSSCPASVGSTPADRPRVARSRTNCHTPPPTRETCGETWATRIGRMSGTVPAILPGVTPAADTAAVEWVALHGDTFAGTRVMVTGAAGFIGSHLTDALASLGATVVAVDDGSAGDWSRLADAEATGRVERQPVSILDPSLPEVAAGCDATFHLAARVSVPRSLTDPAGYLRANADGTLAVLEAARIAGVRRVVYSASSSAYGDSPVLPKREDLPPLPRSPYAATKLAGEHLCRAHASCYPGLDAVSLRYFNIFGPRQSADSAYAGVVAAFCRAVLRGDRPRVHGDGSASRDFTFVANAVHANLLAASRERPFAGEVVNVAAGERRTVLDLARAIAQNAGRPDLTPVHGPSRTGDVAHSLADLARARAELEYAPVVGFDEGLRRTLAWYARRRDTEPRP